MIPHYDVIILGAGAAGLMCAIEAGKRGKSVVVFEKNAQPAEKIRISGGGRCNFTNLHATHEHYLSANLHFCKSALAQYTSSDFIALVEKHGIAYHEKKLGQLFCDRSSREIISLLLDECESARVNIVTNCSVKTVTRNELESGKPEFILSTQQGEYSASSLVIATGGISIPKIGATDFGYRIAKQFGILVNPTQPGLVPFVCNHEDAILCKELSGVSLPAIVSLGKKSFRENILFTHKGLSGPAILQISSYWNQGESITVNCSPEIDLFEYFKNNHEQRKELQTLLADIFPKRFVALWCERYAENKQMFRYSKKELTAIADSLHRWRITPAGTEGFGKAEVTCGGVDTGELSSKTMAAKKIPGLYFIGEVVDVTGELGGYNFQWAWSSGVVAGRNV